MKKYYAEFIGTFLMMFCGTGAMIIDETTNGSITHVGVAITWGLIIMSLIYALGETSGAHFNPAVTIAFTVNKNFPLQQVLPYVGSQFLGGISASLLLKYLFPTSVFLGATVPNGSNMQAFILEIILSFLLMLVVLKVAKGSKEQGLFAGIAIGSVVLLEAMFAGPICGASMNPIRSLTPALVSGHLSQVYIYIIAPPIGMLLAVGFNKLLQ
ncbi:MAG: aquaporin [Deinococcales bacterium]|nr:aquaporin [Chitinophagaceae bacterium]